MNIEINDSTMKELEELAALKDITVEQAAAAVIEHYTSGYVLMVKQAKRAAENAIKRYDK